MSKLNFVITMAGLDRWKIVQFLVGKIKPVPQDISDSIKNPKQKPTNKIEEYVKNIGSNIDEIYDLLYPVRRKRYENRLVKKDEKANELADLKRQLHNDLNLLCKTGALSLVRTNSGNYYMIKKERCMEWIIEAKQEVEFILANISKG